METSYDVQLSQWVAEQIDFTVNKERILRPLTRWSHLQQVNSLSIDQKPTMIGRRVFGLACCF